MARWRQSLARNKEVLSLLENAISILLRTLVLTAVLIGGTIRCWADTGAPASAVRLSKVAETLSKDPALREKLLQSLDSLPNAWGLLGPQQRTRLRNYILDRNWSGIDHFPGMTVGELRMSVSAVNAAANKYPNMTAKIEPPFVEIGPFKTNSGSDVDWLASPEELNETYSSPIKDLGYGLTMGDPPHPELWKWHAQSLRAAYLFNRLSLNSKPRQAQKLRVRLNGQFADSPESLINLLQHSGYDLWIEDSRYFANFGHLHFNGEDVMMPFWLNTKIPLPNSKNTLLTPVSHAEYEIRMRGANGNADVSFYFGIDGMTEFRTMDTLDQYWVGKNVAHSYRDQDAREVARLLGQVLLKYAALQTKYPALPFNGYYRFGVCQDAVAAIEFRMQGRTTLFPITHDQEYFRGDDEIDQLFAKIPSDRGSKKPEWSRVRGSLPAKELADIYIPELRRDLELVSAAQQTEVVEQRSMGVLIGAAALALLVGLLIYRARRNRLKAQAV
jgi:hypothetical protein